MRRSWCDICKNEQDESGIGMVIFHGGSGRDESIEFCADCDKKIKILVQKLKAQCDAKQRRLSERFSNQDLEKFK